METTQDRYRRILGLDQSSETVCFTPFIGEFGWYIMTHIKRVHAYNSNKKIAFIKRGHEALFPSVEEFYYGWEDIPDADKAGIVRNPHISTIVGEASKFGRVVEHTDMSWDEKTSLAHIKFIPVNKINHDFRIDIAFAPRKRSIDALRNIDRNIWQHYADVFSGGGLSVGVVGSQNTTHKIDGNITKSCEYIDVDTDIEIINKSKCVVCQESGILYLAAMCKKPVFIIDHCHREIFDLHRDQSVYFELVHPNNVVARVLHFLNKVG